MDETNLDLNQLIEYLKMLDPQLVLPHGFANPHCYRGWYDELAFEPAENVTVESMLACARAAVGKTFTAIKGGDYTMKPYTDCWLSKWGEASGQRLTREYLESQVRMVSCQVAELQQVGPYTTHEQIGSRLKEARVRAGLTQGQAARLLGLNQEKISLIEKGKRECGVLELTAFSEVYAVSYEWILGQWCESDLPEETVAMFEKMPPVDRRKLLVLLASMGSMY